MHAFCLRPGRRRRSPLIEVYPEGGGRPERRADGGRDGEGRVAEAPGKLGPHERGDARRLLGPVRRRKRLLPGQPLDADLQLRWLSPPTPTWRDAPNEFKFDAGSNLKREPQCIDFVMLDITGPPDGRNRTATPGIRLAALAALARDPDAEPYVTGADFAVALREHLEWADLAQVKPVTPRVFSPRPRCSTLPDRAEDASHEGRSVHQHAVPGRLQRRGPHPRDRRAGACGAGCRLQFAVVSASLADLPDADAADHADDGLCRRARAGHDDRPQHPDPAAAEPDACRRGSRHARCADGRQLHPRHRAGLSPAGVRRVRHPVVGTRAALQREHRTDEAAVDRGPGQPQGPLLHGERCRHRGEAGARGRAAAVYCRPGGRLGEARGPHRRCLADRQQRRPRQGDTADEDLPSGAGRIRPDRHGNFRSPSNAMSAIATPPRTRSAADRWNTNTTPTRPGACRGAAPKPRSRSSPATNSSSATRCR